MKKILLPIIVLVQSLPLFSQNCDISVNCPEGSNWTIHKRSVVRFTTFCEPNATPGPCTGTVIGRTNYDENTVYILTAAHCVNSTIEAENATFFWGYEDGCGGSPNFDEVETSGASLITSNDALDYAIIQTTLPPNYNVFYAGWDISDAPTGMSSTVCMSHPAGCRKKIALSSLTPVSYKPTVAPAAGCSPYLNPPSNSTWKVIFSQGAVGKGSSGSALFNSSKRIVGEMSRAGGPLCSQLPFVCSPPFSFTDKYTEGSFFKSNLIFSSASAKTIIDPENSNVLRFDGYYPSDQVWTADNSYEPNNNYTSAEYLFNTLKDQQSTGFLRSYIQTVGDQDFYKFKLTKAGKITFTLSEVPANQTYGFEIQKPDGTVIQPIAGAYYLTPPAGSSEAVFVARVYGSGPSHSIFSPYKLGFNWEPCIDGEEQNNEQASATPALLQPFGNSSALTTVSSEVSTINDQDFWRIPIEGAGTLTLTLFDLLFNYQLQLMGSSSGLPKYSLNTGTNEEVITYHYAGTNPIDLFALVYGDDGAYAPCNSYKLRLEWQPDAPCVAITLSAQTVPASSGTSQDGSVLLNITGGQSPLTFLWSNGQTTQDLTNVAPGSYSVTVTGNDGCTKTATAYVGIQGSADPYCSGTTTLTQASGNFSDDSGSSNDYTAYSNCRWLISPANATSITLFFPFFNLSDGDVVEVYDGSSVNAPLLATLDNTTLTNIYHSTGGSMYVRFISDGIDEGQGWTASYTSESSSGGPKLVAYEYWFDDDAAGRQQAYFTPVTTKTLNASFNTDGLAQGVHRFHIRFLDEYDNWSSVLSQFFVKQPPIEPNNDNTIEEYEYWFDDDYANRNSGGATGEQTFELNETVYESAQLANGVHRFHVRFKDRAGNWSSVLSQFFVRQPGGGNFPNKVSAYRYWFDLNDAAMNNVTLPSPVNPYELSPSITVTNLNAGLHTVHFQFQDINGNWSSVTNDEFTVGATPVAQFAVTSNPPCSNGMVSFQNNSLNSDTYLWNFGDGQTSTQLSPSHQYAASGTYTVTLTATNTSSGFTSTSSASVTVSISNISASVTPSGNTAFCQGGSLTLTANIGTGYTYQWQLNGSNIPGGTQISQVVTASGTYTVAVTEPSGCSATATPIAVTVNPLPTSNITPSGTVEFCQGNSMTLSANAGAGYSYQWKLNGANITDATAQTYPATAGGTYTVEVTNSFGCTMLSTATTVNVVPAPTAEITPTGSAQICEGQTTILSANTGANLTWQWQRNGNNLTGATSQQFSATVAGTYTVVVTNSAAGCSAVSPGVQVSVLAYPVASILPSGNVAVCEGQSVNLGAGTVANLTYQWQLNGGNIGGATSSTYPASSAGDYVVVVTNGSLCTATSSAVTVQVNPLPNVMATASDNTICEGTSTTLNGTGAQDYTWQPGNLQGASVEVTPSQSTVYTLTGVDQNNCANTATVEITVNPNPTVNLGNDTIICVDATLALHAGTGFVLYLWSTGASGEEITVDAAGTYSVTVVDQNDCSVSDEIVISETPCSGTHHVLKDSEVQLYPNPNSGSFMLSIDSEVTGDLILEIVNPLGQLITSMVTTKANRVFQYDFALTDLPASVYVLKIQLDGLMGWKKFVVER